MGFLLCAADMPLPNFNNLLDIFKNWAAYDGSHIGKICLEISSRKYLLEHLE